MLKACGDPLCCSKLELQHFDVWVPAQVVEVPVGLLHSWLQLQALVVPAG